MYSSASLFSLPKKGFSCASSEFPELQSQPVTSCFTHHGHEDEFIPHFFLMLSCFLLSSLL